MFEKLIESWNEKEILQLQADIVTSFLENDTNQGLETSIEFAKFLHSRELDCENYPIFLEMLLHNNKRVIDALFSDDTPLHAFCRLQKNSKQVNACLEMLKRLPMNPHPKALEMVFGTLSEAYRHPIKGWELYAPSIDELNYLGKYLDKSKPQSSKFNRIVLDILADIGELSLQETEEKEMNRIGAHANKIRNAYFDNREKMEKVIPLALVN